MKEIISRAIDAAKAELCEISDFMYHNPELGCEEFKACQKLTALLKSNGFDVETGTAGMETAFKAVYDSGRPGASVAFFCEYDALPDIGHGCGHNIIGTIGVGAGIGLKSVINETGGRVLVFGAPAEETIGGKIVMAEQGLFDDIDFGLMLHPDAKTAESGSMLAMDSWQFDFRGKPAHAAAEPEKGISALDAVIMLFNGINAYRQFLKSDARIHGIVHNGGAAPNIVPEYASARFYVRAQTREYLEEISRRIFDIAEGAAKMTGAAVEISKFENSFDNLTSNTAMSKAWRENMRMLGFTEIDPPKSEMGSSDIGNVSQKAPVIHGTIDLGDPELIIHTREAAALTITDTAHDRIVQGAKSLAFTGYDLLADPELASRAKKEFEDGKEKRG